MSDVRAKALGYLRDGKVIILRARILHLTDQRPEEVLARVTGHHGTYVVDLISGQWHCYAQRCLLSSDETCAHVAAVQLVTGHPSAAARDALS